MKRLTALIVLGLLSAPALGQDLTPSPNSIIGAGRPLIQASFNRDIGQARIWVDGTDFTPYADRRGRKVTFTPPYNLDYGTHQVRVQTDYGQVTEWSFDISRNATNNGFSPNQGWNQGGAVAVKSYGPQPNSVVTVTRPPVVAIFNDSVHHIRMSVDNVDVSGAAATKSNRITWNPGYDLDEGQHNCVVTATDSNGGTVRGQWSFTIRSR